MRRAVLIVMLTLSISACMSYRPVEEPAQEIQRRIVSEELLTPGDAVKVVTRDGRVQKLRIAGVDVDQGKLTGEDDVVVRIDEITALQKRRLSWAKTGALIGGLLWATLSDCEDTCGDSPFREEGIFCCP